MKNIKITQGTIVRTILMALVLLNLILKACGVKTIDASEDQITSIVSTVIQIAIIVVNWWKNNSFSEEAIKADEFLQGLRTTTEESKKEE